MASQVLSGASNPTYTNNTGQNVRLIINYMSSVTSMSWAGVNVTSSSTTIGADIQNITGEFRQIDASKLNIRTTANPGAAFKPLTLTSESAVAVLDQSAFAFDQIKVRGTSVGPTLNTAPTSDTNVFYVPLTVSRGGNFPTELMLANGQSFSSVCGAYNIVVIKENGG